MVFPHGGGHRVGEPHLGENALAADEKSGAGLIEVQNLELGCRGRGFRAYLRKRKRLVMKMMHLIFMQNTAFRV